MNWFKFYGQEFLLDPKMMGLTAIEKALWVTILALASQNNGVIEHINESKILILTGIGITDDEWTENEGFLKKFEKLEMLQVSNEESNEKVTILNWEKRQQTSLTNAERQAKFRAKHNENSNEKVTESNDNSNARIDKIRKEKNIYITDVIEKSEITPSNKLTFGNPDINLLKDYFLQAMSLPKEDCTQEQSRRYWSLLLKESKTGVDGVKWLIDLGKQDEFYKNNLTSSKDLYYKRVKLMARKRGDKPQIAVIS